MRQLHLKYVKGPKKKKKMEPAKQKHLRHSKVLQQIEETGMYSWYWTI